MEENVNGKPPKCQCNVAPELFQSWQRLYRRGDMEDMAKKLGYSHPAISKALKYGYVTIAELPDKINQYFEDRLTKEKEAAKKLNDLAGEVEGKKEVSHE